MNKLKMFITVLAGLSKYILLISITDARSDDILYDGALNYASLGTHSDVNNSAKTRNCNTKDLPKDVIEVK